MNNNPTKTIIFSVIISFLLFVLFGRFVAAKISTLPLLNRWRLVSPQAPIVITNREEVRISDSTDIVQAVISAKSKLSAIARVTKDGSLAMTGGAVNVTGDGTFVTGRGAVSADENATYYVVLADGRKAKVGSVVIDPATALAFIKADIGNVPAAPLGNSALLSPGEKVVFLSNDFIPFTTRVLSSIVSVAEPDFRGRTYNSDFPSRSFAAQAAGPLVPGQAAINTKGEIVGIFSGADVVSSDVLKRAVNIYLSSGGKISRPYFGFSYSMISKTESSILEVPAGAKVTGISKPTKAITVIPAQQGGLLEGDIITAVDKNALNGEQLLETYLEGYKPGDSAVFTVQRGKSQAQVTIKAGELK